MKIDGTELEYSEADAVVLDYSLGGHSETKEEWAKRVWDKCKEWQETDGKGYDEKGVLPIYSRSPKSIWNEKKSRRRIIFMMEFASKQPNEYEKNLLSGENVDFEKSVTWSDSHNDQSILLEGSKSEYKTSQEKFVEENQKWTQEIETEKQKRIDNVSKLRSKGFDDETIEIIYPFGKSEVSKA